uniref:hypothetical protein ORF GIIM n=1 Tax=Chlamydomonas chlamydogama TaxID=225041 RepID=UPI00226C64A9|nr:hypothetical protein ORF GIIM [Chlamydomonas chlamydogama]UZA61935.1 hypothetical protein ORF GIIM [Chlamydomonas chlamydogama]
MKHEKLVKIGKAKPLKKKLKNMFFIFQQEIYNSLKNQNSNQLNKILKNSLIVELFWINSICYLFYKKKVLNQIIKKKQLKLNSLIIEFYINFLLKSKTTHKKKCMNFNKYKNSDFNNNKNLNYILLSSFKLHKLIKKNSFLKKKKLLGYENRKFPKNILTNPLLGYQKIKKFKNLFFINIFYGLSLFKFIEPFLFFTVKANLKNYQLYKNNILTIKNIFYRFTLNFNFFQILNLSTNFKTIEFFLNKKDIKFNSKNHYRHSQTNCNNALKIKFLADVTSLSKAFILLNKKLFYRLNANAFINRQALNYLQFFKIQNSNYLKVTSLATIKSFKTLKYLNKTLLHFRTIFKPNKKFLFFYSNKTMSSVICNNFNKLILLKTKLKTYVYFQYQKRVTYLSNSVRKKEFIQFNFINFLSFKKLNSLSSAQMMQFNYSSKLNYNIFLMEKVDLVIQFFECLSKNKSYYNDFFHILLLNKINNLWFHNYLIKKILYEKKKKLLFKKLLKNIFLKNTELDLSQYIELISIYSAKAKFLLQLKSLLQKKHTFNIIRLICKNLIFYNGNHYLVLTKHKSVSNSIPLMIDFVYKNKTVIKLTFSQQNFLNSIFKKNQTIIYPLKKVFFWQITKENFFSFSTQNILNKKVINEIFLINLIYLLDRNKFLMFNNKVNNFFRDDNFIKNIIIELAMPATSEQPKVVQKKNEINILKKNETMVHYKDYYFKINKKNKYLKVLIPFIKNKQLVDYSTLSKVDFLLKKKKYKITLCTLNNVKRFLKIVKLGNFLNTNLILKKNIIYINSNFIYLLNLLNNLIVNITLRKTSALVKERKLSFLSIVKKNEVQIIPSKTAIRAHLKEIKMYIKKCSNLNQEILINKLAPLIRQFAKYYQFCTNKYYFYYCENQLLKLIWKWCCKRHHKKNKSWIKSKYFNSWNGKRLNFSLKKLTLNESNNRTIHSFNKFKKFKSQKQIMIISNKKHFFNILITLPSYLDINLEKNFIFTEDLSFYSLKNYSIYN